MHSVCVILTIIFISSDTFSFIFFADKTPFLVTKIEPWNSVRVTFYISKEAAQRLRLLAERRDDQLRDLGVLSVQVEGDQVSLSYS